jgi:hypothetical protein
MAGWSRALRIALALARLAAGNLDLLYWALPRRWRGGYRSPWLARERLR